MIFDINKLLFVCGAIFSMTLSAMEGISSTTFSDGFAYWRCLAVAGDRMITGSLDGSAKIFDLTTGKLLHSHLQPGSVILFI